MNLFAILRHHVATQPNAIASRSSRRTVTYRKFWSRIERATARLKAEWHVQPGDTVAYWGQGHQDALMLYIAVARCGARLLPLEHTLLQKNSKAILQKIPSVLLLHDDETVFELPPAATVITNLSSLIATRCHQAPLVSEDITQPSLIFPGTIEDGYVQANVQSLQQLLATAAPHIKLNAAQEFKIEKALFDTDIFASQVLPVLVGGGTIIFR